MPRFDAADQLWGFLRNNLNLLDIIGIRAKEFGGVIDSTTIRGKGRKRFASLCAPSLAEPLPLLRLFRQQGHRLGRDDSSLAGTQMTAMIIRRHNPRDERSLTLPFHELRLDA